MGGIAPRIYTA